VERLPDDPAARRLWLEQWADDQERRLGPRDLPPLKRLRTDAARRMQRAVARYEKYAEKVFDRSLHTGELVLDDP
jgi:hypothetical protein